MTLQKFDEALQAWLRDPKTTEHLFKPSRLAALHGPGRLPVRWPPTWNQSRLLCTDLDSCVACCEAYKWGQE